MSENQIPVKLLVGCPAKNFMLRVAAHCGGCEFCGGLIDLAKSDRDKNQMKWHERHQIICRHPISRRVTPFEID